MYERFTDRARKVMQLANQEAQRFNHEYVGTEHILLGLVKEGSGVASYVIRSFGVDLRSIRMEVEKIVTAGPDMVTMGKLPHTPRAKKVIEYAIGEASKLKHNYIGTEHILLGLLLEEEGVAAQVLRNLGINLFDVSEEVLYLLGHAPKGEPLEPTTTGGQTTEWVVEVPQNQKVYEAMIQTLESKYVMPWLHGHSSSPAPAEACCDPSACPELVEEISTRTHKFWIRDDFEVEIVLPKDITPTEVDRLCQFISLITE